MSDNAIEIRDATLAFPMRQKRNSIFKLSKKKSISTSKKGNNHTKQNTIVDFGSTPITWPVVENAEIYRFLLRNYTIGEIVLKPELYGNKYLLDWKDREKDNEYWYRIQYKMDDDEWRDLEPYKKLVQPEPREIVIEESTRKKSKKFFRAIDSLSLNVKRGEIVGIIGKNGCGKSTLMRMIGGIYSPDSGYVRTFGKVTLLIGLGVGFENQMTGRENIMLTGSIYGMKKETLKDLLPNIIEYSGINPDFIDQPLRTYSSGMRSRLGFSIVSFMEPEILLLDEVMSAGDYDFKKKSQKRIMEMVNSNSTAVIVSHDPGLLSRICDKVYAMNDGKIVSDGDIGTAISIYESS